MTSLLSRSAFLYNGCTGERIFTEGNEENKDFAAFRSSEISLFVNFASFCCSYLSQPEKEFLQKVAKETKAGVGICNPSLTSLPSVHVFSLFGGFYLCGLSCACA